MLKSSLLIGFATILYIFAAGAVEGIRAAYITKPILFAIGG